MVSQYFYPEQFRINDICEEWIKRGHEVTVLTGIPNYPSGDFYKGYSYKKKRHENYKGIEIIRIPLIPRKKNSLMLALNYLSFVLSGNIWAMIHKVDYDEVFVYEVSPMTQALPAVKFAKKNKIPCYIYVMDLWPENFEIISGITNPLVIKVLNKMVDYIYRHCSMIFTASESFKTNIENRGLEKEKVIFWPQYAEDFYRPTSQKSTLLPYDQKKLTITFAGNIGEAQGLEILPTCAKLLKKQNINCRFVLVGDGRFKEQLKKLIIDLDVESFFLFIDPVSATEIPFILSSSDFSLISLKKNKIFSMTIPAKLQSSMACGAPIIVAANGEIQKIIEESNCGFVSDAGDAEGLAKIIVKASKLTKNEIRVMGEASREFYLNNYDKKKLMDQMEHYLRNDGSI